MQILIVTAHPSKKGLTHAIASTYAETKRKQGHTVEIVDLYAKENTHTGLIFENLKDFSVTSIQKKFQEQIIKAHEIVVVHPIWWGTPPSVMKRWVELAFWPHVAYHYTGPNKWDKLLEGKSAKVFATCGGPSWIYHFPFTPLKAFWGNSVFGFCGVDLVEMKICGNLNNYTGQKLEKHIATFLQSLRKKK